jgi:hypothetical protein
MLATSLGCVCSSDKHSAFRLIDTVLCPAQEFSLNYRDVTIAGEGLHNLGLCSAFRAFEQGSLSCHTCCDTGPRFFRSHPNWRTAPYSRPLQHAWGCGGPILTGSAFGSENLECFEYKLTSRSPVPGYLNAQFRKVYYKYIIPRIAQKVAPR